MADQWEISSSSRFRNFCNNSRNSFLIQESVTNRGQENWSDQIKNSEYTSSTKFFYIEPVENIFLYTI